MKVIEEPWENLYGEKVPALSLETESQYTISEFITLLEEAKKRYGDKTILFHEMNTNTIGGFSHIYYDKKDDRVCIYG